MCYACLYVGHPGGSRQEGAGVPGQVLRGPELLLLPVQCRQHDLQAHAHLRVGKMNSCLWF